jgi:single-stranded-DNA-specific exonuclease
MISSESAARSKHTEEPVSTTETVLDRRIEPRWVIAERPDSVISSRLRDELPVSSMMAKILINRGIEDVDFARAFLEPRLEDLIDPFTMRDMPAASARIWQAIDANEQILVHGDYDVDGVTSTALLVRTLGALGATVTFYIPNRLEEGYGISHEAIDSCVAHGTTLLISVDCGITATAETLYAKENGVDVIITDHHQSGVLPEAIAVVNPKRPDCDYPFKELSGVALAFKLSDAVYRDRGVDPEPVYRNMDLVALGCAADIVPLVGENRILVSNGLRRMERTENEGLKALLRGAKLTGRRLGTSPLIFVLAPRINALGRMGSALDAVTMLTTDDPAQAVQIAGVLETQNRVRRQVDDRMYREAVELVEQEPDLSSARALVLASDSWHPGVIGIVASRIAERVHLPTVLISLDGDRGKGSARSIAGFDLYEAVSRCQEYLVAFGGHKYAAGLTIDRDQVDVFRKALVSVAEEMMVPENLTPRLEIDDEITLDQIDRRMVEMLRRFAPFGPQNPRPVMVSRGVEVVGAPSVVGRNHLRFKARQNGAVLDCIGYNLGHLTYRLTPGEANLDMAYVIEENEWRGRKDIQLRVSDLR